MAWVALDDAASGLPAALSSRVIMMSQPMNGAAMNAAGPQRCPG